MRLPVSRQVNRPRPPGQDEGTALRRARDAVMGAEAAGCDDAWMAEHHVMSYGTCPSAITFAAHAVGAASPRRCRWYRYHPGMTGVPGGITPLIYDRSFTIDASVLMSEVPHTGNGPVRAGPFPV
ncbi:LLM class flavin-dependent oxidoreductase [Amycolatopsis acididurans]|uniref:LLM class flavin-dependent oxidoreductase n=1 Tax=Amycolatopsis acididurans TaxID=2724524 RepID=UPI001FEC49F7|nr:LLM class flavin-dependent oxidoreductase [Amycolatopsis acididurans]